MNALTQEEHHELFRKLHRIPEAQDGLFLSRAKLQDHNIPVRLYLRWWAFRPIRCKRCHQNRRWIPGTEDVRYSCSSCFNDVFAPPKYGLENEYIEAKEGTWNYAEIEKCKAYVRAMEEENVAVDYVALFFALENSRMALRQGEVVASEVVGTQDRDVALKGPSVFFSDRTAPLPEVSMKPNLVSKENSRFSTRVIVLGHQRSCPWNFLPDVMRTFCTYAALRGIDPSIDSRTTSWLPWLCLFHVLYPLKCMRFVVLRHILRGLQGNEAFHDLDGSSVDSDFVLARMRFGQVPRYLEATSFLEEVELPPKGIDSEQTLISSITPPPYQGSIHTPFTVPTSNHLHIPSFSRTVASLPTIDFLEHVQSLAHELALTPSLLILSTPEAAFLYEQWYTTLESNHWSRESDTAPEDLAGCVLLTALLYAPNNLEVLTPFQDHHLYATTLANWIATHLRALFILHNPEKDTVSYSSRGTEQGIGSILPSQLRWKRIPIFLTGI